MLGKFYIYVTRSPDTRQLVIATTTRDGSVVYTEVADWVQDGDVLCLKVRSGGRVEYKVLRDGKEIAR